MDDPAILQAERWGSPVSFKEDDEIDEITEDLMRIFRKYPLTCDWTSFDVRSYIELMAKELG